MSGFHFTPKAQTDLESHQDYIARDRPGASLAWVETLASRCATLAKNPGWGRRREELRPGLRSLPFGRYVIFYRVSARGVEIARVLHASRDLKTEFP
ncbi:MAG: type II toxin-antitoxin system RelE/ParE family toxin [Opitutus sp.]|nr:type II toxin-antitoxin system RelE/ParE family toxin [Opitutus sp.]